MVDDQLPTVPFFIVGNPRSGTTLLRSILCGHSRLEIPDETGFLAHLDRYRSRILSRTEVADLVREIGDMNLEWSGLVEDLDGFCDRLPDPTLTRVLDELYRIKTDGAPRWGDKGPSYVRVLAKLNQIFPSAQFIHVIRDGRDSVLSALRKWGDRYWYYDTYFLLQTWKRNVEAGRAAASWLGPKRYLEVRYEHLVEDTEASVRRICEFLDERFEPTMLDNTAAGERISGPTGHVEVAAPVNTRSVSAWQTSMTIFDQKLSQHLAGSLLKELGYEIPDLPPMTTAERLRTLRLATRFVGLDVARRTLFASGWLKMSREKAVAQNPSKIAT